MGEPALRGFLNIDKPAGITSFDVVQRIRRAVGVKRVGHAGTLDPLATGVLPIAVGDATRLIDGLVDARKRYRTTIALGIETTTFDAEGEVVARVDASRLTFEAVRDALAAFEGERAQTPPAFSALKRDGVTAYDAARAGEPLDLEPRVVTAHALRLLDVRVADASVEADVDIECSKGYYVRSLAHDLGAALGVGGHVNALRRTAVGPFRVEDALPLERAEALLEAGAWDAIACAPDIALLDSDAVILARESVATLRRGQDIRPAPRAVRRVLAPGIRVRAYGIDGTFVGILQATAVPGQWHPYRVLAYNASKNP
ncbi:MAG: tRNA pseudouridine(55) synthase TruB [Dehalococcoidia bacterium]